MLESTSMTTQPGLHRLIADKLSVLVSTPGQCHDEEPGFERLAREDILDQRALTKIDLCCLASGELEHRGHSWCGLGEALHEASHRRVAAGETVTPFKGSENGGALYAVFNPLGDLLTQRFQAGGLSGTLLFGCAEDNSQLLIGWQCLGGVQPASFDGFVSDTAGDAPAHDFRLGDLSIRFPKAHPHQGLTIVMHFYTPIGHPVLFPHKGVTTIREKVGQFEVESGARVAPLERSSGGSIRAILTWLH